MNKPIFTPVDTYYFVWDAATGNGAMPKIRLSGKPQLDQMVEILEKEIVFEDPKQVIDPKQLFHKRLENILHMPLPGILHAAYFVMREEFMHGGKIYAPSNHETGSIISVDGAVIEGNEGFKRVGNLYVPFYKINPLDSKPMDAQGRAIYILKRTQFDPAYLDKVPNF